MTSLDFSRIPDGLTDFELLRKNNCIYVDKTEQIASIAKEWKWPVFISRPRRFGKSLLVSTLHSLFAHGLEFFKGLEIDEKKLWNDTNTYKVIDLSFARRDWKINCCQVNPLK